MLGRSINRTVAAGLLAIPGASFVTPEASAPPPSYAFENGTGNCATVYDETRPNHNEVDPKLATQIGTLAALGVTVHIQIWDGAKAHSIDANESLQKAINTTVATCKWSDANSLALTFVRYTKNESAAANNSVGKFDVREKGLIDQQISDAQVNSARSQLATALRDPQETEQADLAAFLAAITPGQGSRQPDQAAPKMPPSEFDWSKIWLGVIALGVLGAVTAGVIRGKRIFDSHNTKQATISDIFQTIDELLRVKDGEVGSIYTSGNPLDIDWGDNPVTARDDPGLESMLKEKGDLDAIIEELRTLRDGLEALAKPWSGATLQKIEEIRGNVTSLLDKVPRQKEQYLESRATAIEAIASAPKAVDELTSLLVNFEAQINMLEQAGWDVSSLRQSLSKHSEANGGVAIAMSKQHLITVSAQAKEILNHLKEESADASKAEETFTSNTTRHETRSKVVNQYNDMLKSDRSTLTALQEQFDASCTQRIDTLRGEVQSLTNDLERIQTKLSVVVGEKSFKALDEVAQQTDGFTRVQMSLDQKRKELADTIARLEKLAEQLPSDVSESEKAYDTDRKTVEVWGKDIDDDVITNLQDMKNTFEKLRTDLKDKRPEYFEIETSFNETKAKVDRLVQTAREQRAEAEELRSNIASGNASAKEELEELRSYVRDNDDAGNVSTNIDFDTFSTSGSRKDLQEEFSKQNQLRQRIARRLADAKSAVREAEEKRERERLAVIAAAEEARRREQEEEDRRRQSEEASRSSYNTGDIGGDSSPSHNTSDL